MGFRFSKAFSNGRFPPPTFDADGCAPYLTIFLYPGLLEVMNYAKNAHLFGGCFTFPQHALPWLACMNCAAWNRASEEKWIVVITPLFYGIQNVIVRVGDLPWWVGVTSTIVAALLLHDEGSSTQRCSIVMTGQHISSAGCTLYNANTHTLAY